MNFKKINSRVTEMFDKGEFDSDFVNTSVSSENIKRLYEYQILHVYNLIASLKKNDVIIDGSSTGTGKTYTAACVCSELKLQPLIICPKSIINIWQGTCDYFNVKPLAIVNYETIKLGQVYDKDGKRVTAPYLNINKNNKGAPFEWKFKPNQKVVMIFDEAHKCKNKSSLNGKLLVSAKGACKIMMLSATLSDTIDNFSVFGFMLSLYSKIERGRNWIKSIIREDKNKLVNTRSSTLNKYLFPQKGSRMNIEDLGDKFPKNQITADCYTIESGSQKEIDKQYNKIRGMYKSNEREIVAILRCRQQIELLKVPILFEQAQKYLESNKSVVIFVNFTDTLESLAKLFADNGVEHATIRGGQNEERDHEINKFQTNVVRVIICMVQAGSIGLSLHDTTGFNPRVSLISPSFSSIDLIQTLGRIYRAGIVAPVLQRIIFCANTFEVSICQRIKQKLNFINYLSDEDLIHF
jgi:SNF2 family DNA or RNA helicase